MCAAKVVNTLWAATVTENRKLRLQLSGLPSLWSWTTHVNMDLHLRVETWDQPSTSLPVSNSVEQEFVDLALCAWVWFKLLTVQLLCTHSGQQQGRMHQHLKTWTSLNRLQLKDRLLLEEVSLLPNGNWTKTRFLFFSLSLGDLFIAGMCQCVSHSVQFSSVFILTS